jgi:hypothetical protein
MPRLFVPLTVALAALLTACPSPPEAPPGPGAVPPGASSAGNAQGSPTPNGQPPPSGSQPTAASPAPVGAATPSGNPTGPPVPPAEGPHAGEFDPNAGKGTESDPMATDLRLVPPQNVQDDIRKADHYAIKGSVEGSCDGGALRVDVLEDLAAPPAPGSAPPGPLAALDMAAPGRFEVLVPKGKKVMLSAVCDANNDGVIQSTEPVSEPGTAEGISGAKSGISLKLSVPGR